MIYTGALLLMVISFTAMHDPDETEFSDGWVLAALALGTCVVYRMVFSAAFVYEDTHWLPIWQGGAFPSLAWLAYLPWIAATKIGGGAPWAYHAMTLIVHLVNGLLLYALLRNRIDGAIWAVGLFWLAPVNVEAVAYISGARDALMASWVLLALLCGASESWPWLRVLGIALCTGAALATKSSGIVALGLVPIGLFWLNFAMLKRCLPVLFLGVIAVAIPVTRYVVGLQSSEGILYIGLSGAFTYAAVTAAALLRYLWPLGLSVDHDWIAVPEHVRAAALAILAVGGALIAVNWRRAPLVAAATVWALVAVLPRFVIQQAEVLNEHQVYLAYLGVWIVGGSVLAQLSTFTDRSLSHARITR